MTTRFAIVLSMGLLMLLCGLVILPLMRGTAQAQSPISVLTVDCTPLVSPGMGSWAPKNTMGLAIQSVDQGGEFNVTEVTPAAFRAMTAPQLAAFDLIAINNNPTRLGDGCVAGAGSGLGTTWHSVIGVNSGGRVILNSHDAPYYKMNLPPGSGFFGQGAPGPGVEPHGADDIVRQAALWAGGGSQTGLLIFNDSTCFHGGVGWDNPELNLPAAWGITDLIQCTIDGGYTDILPAYESHPVYAGLSDARFGVNTISSFAANIADGSFHSIFGSYDGTIFTATEVVINAGIVDVGGFNATFGIGIWAAAPGPDGTAISLIRDEGVPPPTPTPTPPPAVGGIVDLRGGPADLSAGQADTAAPFYIALASGVAAGAIALAAGAWYARRRWLG